MNESHLSFKSYVFGFLLSLIFTFSAYVAVTSPTLTTHFVLPFIIVLAFLQLITQLIFFLHMGKEKSPRWNLFIFFTTLTGICILVFGSLWIMNHLNYSMTPQYMNSHILQDEGIHL